ncbi:MAG TPA: M14 family zinc carboxypeptidase [Longimicrobiales bacterium]
MARPFAGRRAPRGVMAVLLTALAVGAAASTASAQQPLDQAYTADIRRYTTEPFFLTPLVDHLPASETVPTPRDVLGHIVGAADVLSYPEEIYDYMRAVDAASDRVKVFSIGRTEEGREMILVVVADEQTIADLDRYKEMLARLADPRVTSEAEAARIIEQAKPIYYATGAIHAPETGSPEMLMELVYRLAVEESEHIRAIRDNLIFMATPIVEVDGRAKVVDLHMAHHKDPDTNVPTRPLYWGKYVAHDNNRDGMGLALKLTQNVLNVFLEYHPTVLHDLHESASYLYTSTGRGPYNAWIDPIVINEWSRLAYKEVQDMTAFGVPGIYTHDYYDGWAPNYLFWIANMRNAIGRFYETQGSRNASNYIVRTNVDREWHRPNTPLPEVVWSIRNNVNLQQSALLIAMREVADNRREYLRNFYRKSVRAVAKATTEGPAAYVMPADDPRPGQQARMLSLLQRQGIEVQRATAAFTADGREFPAGSYVIRMDQPYSRAADMLLDKQYYNPSDPQPYDDTGWTFGPLFNVETVRIEDTSVLDVPMAPVEGLVRAPGAVRNADGARVFLIDYNADNTLASFRFHDPKLRIDAAEPPFTHEGRSYRAGTFIVRGGGDVAESLESAAETFGFTAYGSATAPDVPTHPVATPRIAVMHTWQSTQSEGWVRIALDEYGIPYDYISVHDVRDDPDLGDKYDVIIFGPSSSNALSIVRGITGSEPIPWKPSELTPNIGRQDRTDDMRGGLELTGVLHLQRFVEQGGTLLTLTSSASLPIHFGLAPGVRIRETGNLWAPGGVFRVERTAEGSPLAYGYDDELGVYFDSGPVFALGGGGFGRGFRGRRGGGAVAAEGSTTAHLSGRGGVGDEDIVQARPRDMGQAGVEAFRAANENERDQNGDGGAADVRTIFRFSRDVGSLLISGGLDHGAELAGAPALVDVRLGSGHVVMFSFNPMWRAGTLGSYALVFNALLHHGNLDAGTEVAAAVTTAAGAR